MTAPDVGAMHQLYCGVCKLDVMACNCLSITAGMERSSYFPELSSGAIGLFGKKRAESLTENGLTINVGNVRDLL
ncbi:hypothetical protein [Thalassospira tepidiphila]|uniref:hypothetical protein n=1 Tax=Thalassospira tepidiphila TaxID=393657 RepID=UPI00291CAD75|nr:hypothetical protein MACH01_21610 [Thalassospira tepidiphila]